MFLGPVTFAEFLAEADPYLSAKLSEKVPAGGFPQTYIDDFAKYAEGADLALMQSIFRAIPAHVGEKVKYVNYSRDVKAAKISAVIDLFTIG